MNIYAGIDEKRGVTPFIFFSAFTFFMQKGNRMYIGLIGDENDPQLIHLASALTQQNTPYFIANTAYFGSQWTISFDPDCNEGYLHFTQHQLIPKQRVMFSQIKAVYWHQYIPTKTMIANSDTSSASKNLQQTAAQAVWIEQELSSTLLCWFTYHGTKWVNSIDAVRSHQCKPMQLSIASQQGANIPYSFVGNAPEAAAQFCSNLQEVVYKPVRGGKVAQFVNKTEHLRPLLTTLLSQRPVTFQKYISGTNIRSYVLGNEVVSVRIDSDELDYRNDDGATPVITLIPQHIKRLAVRICKALGMYWCAIDWRKTNKDTYFFLEANPSPFYLKVERDTGLDITGRLLNLLTM